MTDADRIYTELVALRGDMATAREQLAAMAERFSPRSDVAALDKRLAQLEGDMRKIVGAIGATAAAAVSALLGLAAQLFQG
jgi:hypothetical protein